MIPFQESAIGTSYDTGTRVGQMVEQRLVSHGETMGCVGPTQCYLAMNRHNVVNAAITWEFHDSTSVLLR